MAKELREHVIAKTVACSDCEYKNTCKRGKDKVKTVDGKEGTILIDEVEKFKPIGCTFSIGGRNCSYDVEVINEPKKEKKDV